MKLVTFKTKNDELMRRGALVDTADGQKVAPVSGDFNAFGADELAAVQSELSQLAPDNMLAMDEVTLGNPLPRPGKIICVGLNYLDHVLETKSPMPDHPILFAKWHNTLAGPNDVITLDGTSQAVDYEAELAFVIGKTAYNVPEAEAMDYVAGYLTANDLSARDLQFADTQWVRGKSLNGFCPLGPFIATKDEIADPHNLRIMCRVNGETLQDSNTGQLIFKIPFLIAWISSGLTLNPGDVVLTGTPPGVGNARDPKIFLHPGDTCDIEIEGLGVLTNTFN